MDAENKRFNAGLSQNYLVLQRQNELASAQLSELQALITYRTAIITLQQAMFTLLDASDVEVAKGSSTKIRRLQVAASALREFSGSGPPGPKFTGSGGLPIFSPIPRHPAPG